MFIQVRSSQNLSATSHWRVEDVVSGRLLSTSFIAAMPIKQQQQLKIQFEQIVADYTGKTAQDEIAFPYLTHAYNFKKTAQNTL